MIIFSIYAEPVANPKQTPLLKELEKLEADSDHKGYGIYRIILRLLKEEIFKKLDLQWAPVYPQKYFQNLKGR